MRIPPTNGDTLMPRALRFSTAICTILFTINLTLDWAMDTPPGGWTVLCFAVVCAYLVADAIERT